MEFQGRGTEHIHLVLWCLLLANYVVVGRTGEPHMSKLVNLLEDLFGSRVDVQMGAGYLNYINGYATRC